MTETRPKPLDEKVASLTTLPVQAIDQIGDAAALAIEDAATRIETEAKQKADRLRDFAQKMREQTRKCSTEVGDFCLRMADIFTTNENLEARLDRPTLDESNVRQLATRVPE